MKTYKNVLNVFTHVAYGVIVVLSALVEVFDKILSK